MDKQRQELLAREVLKDKRTQLQQTPEFAEMQQNATQKKEETLRVLEERMKHWESRLIEREASLVKREQAVREKELKLGIVGARNPGLDKSLEKSTLLPRSSGSVMKSIV